MYSQLHPHLAKARNAEGGPPPHGRGPAPPGRLRGRAAFALAGVARRLDADRARRAVAS